MTNNITEIKILKNNIYTTLEREINKYIRGALSNTQRNFFFNWV